VFEQCANGAGSSRRALSEWESELKKNHVDLCIFEIYKNVEGSFVYRAFGSYPEVYAEKAHCRRDSSIPNLLEIIGNINLIEKT